MFRMQFLAGLSLLFAASASTGQLADAACPMDALMAQEARARVRCVTFEVAESADRPLGRRLTLRAAVVSPGVPAQGVPLLFLHGGPGGQAVRTYRWFLNDPLGARTVVLLDQRASGESTPSLCPDLREADLGVTVRAGDSATRAADRLRLFRACRESLRRDGVDLNAYSPAAVVGDAEQLRQALGIDRWDLLGISYGTRIALAYRARAAQSVRAMVLDSVSPPGRSFFVGQAAALAQSLRAFDGICARDLACRQRWGSLDAAVVAAAEGLRHAPLRLPVDDPLAIDGAISLSAPLFLLAVQQLLYDRELYPILPLLVDRVRQRDAASLRNLAAQLLTQTRRGDRVDVVAAFECGQAGTAADEAEAGAGLPPVLSELSDNHRWVRDLCPVWVEGPGLDAPDGPVQAGNAVPALVLAGAIDPITPPAGSRRVAQLLGATHAELPYTGHGALLEPCGKALAAAFLSDPGRAPDTGCAAQEMPVEFVQRAVLVPGAGQLADRLQRGDPWWTGLLVVLAAALGSVVSWPWLGRNARAGSGSVAGRWLENGPPLALAALCLLGFGAGLAAAVATTLTEVPALLLLGLQAVWWPLFVLPWIAAAGLAWVLGLRFGRGRMLAPRHWVVLAGLLGSLTAIALLGLLTPTLV